jgi:hypothetical protein
VAAEVEGVLVAFCFVFVFEAVVAVGACILFFHFVRAGFGVSIHVCGKEFGGFLPEVIWVVEFLGFLWTTIADE